MFEEKFLGLPWLVWAILALIVALLYAFVIPNSKIMPDTSGLQLIVLRWFHPLVWLCLTVMFLMRSKLLPGGVLLANSIGLVALALYIIFMVVLFRS